MMMDAPASAPTPGRSTWPLSWSSGFIGLLVLSVLAFWASPWSIQDKSLAILHGLCAQRPSHSFWFGPSRLPFDARMTGIYGGFLLCQLYFVARLRLHAVRLPSLSLILALGVFVVAMAIDGFNSLAGDLGLPMLYSPSNTLRYATGSLFGTTLGVFLWLLTVNVLWKPDEERPARPLVRWPDLLWVLGLSAGFGLLAMSDLGPLYQPLAIALVVAAVVAVFQMVLIVIQLGRRREQTATRLADLAGPATAALLTTYAILFVIAGGRYLLETLFPVTPLP